MMRWIGRASAIGMLLGTSLSCAGADPTPATPTQAFSHCTPTTIGELLGVDVANLYSNSEPSKPLPAGGSSLNGPRDLLRGPAVMFLSEDGSPTQIHCDQTKVFVAVSAERPSPVAISCSLCSAAPLARASLSGGLERVRRVQAMLPPSPLNSIRHEELGGGIAADVFMLILIGGHGAGLLPTAVVTGERDPNSLVVQVMSWPGTSSGRPPKSTGDSNSLDPLRIVKVLTGHES